MGEPIKASIGREPEPFDVWCPDDSCADASSFRSRMVETRPGFWACPECGATVNDSELEDPVAPLPQRMSSGWTVTDEMLEAYRTGPPVGGGLSWNESKRARLQAVLDLAAPPPAEIPTVTDEMVETFKAAWNEADREGLAGQRVECALREVFAQCQQDLRALARVTAPPGNAVATDAPIPMRLTCPSCGELHIDVGEFATKPHHTHACQHCGMVWRPAVEPTVGVRFLPGYRNEETDRG